MMFGNRLELTWRLKLKSDLRIGSGHVNADGRLKQREEDDAAELALVIRDHQGRPIIPATALKGALRGQAPLANSEADALLGERGEAEENKGAIARLWVDTAVATDAAPPGLEGLTKKGCARDHTYVKIGVRLDRRTGSAEDKLLYNQEWVGAGTVFEGRATLFLDDADEATLLDRLARALAPLVQSPGLALGADGRHGAGRITLAPPLCCKRRTIDPARLALVDEDAPDLARKLLADAARHNTAESMPIRLYLRAEGPFISMRDKTTEPDDGKEITRPLKRQGMPHLWPSSLLGALRTRAAWLAEIDHLRRSDRWATSGAGRRMDDPDKVVLDTGEVAGLSSVERLFGVAGWRGLLQVARLEPAADCSAATARLTSVTIDRFTGGAMDKRLFTEEAFIDARFEVDLVIDSRGTAFDKPADGELLDALVADLVANGLELGHGAAKGFGWFEVEQRA